MNEDVRDITIIGAGPTGLFAAFYAGLREMSTKVVEALPEPGGQLSVLYPEKLIYDVPGHPKILAQDLVRALLDQCALFSPLFVYEQRIDTLTRATIDGEEVWRLGTSAGEPHYSRTVVITAGIGAFAPMKIDRPGISDYEGKGVFYFVKDKRPFRGKRILIVGGGDTAVDWCLNLKDWAREITLIHRREQFRAHEASLAALRKTEIPIMTFHELKRVAGDGQVESATIFDNRTGVESDLKVDAVLVNIGFKAALGPIDSWGLELADTRHIRVDGFMETRLKGVFAAGDIAAVDGSEPLNLIVTGFGQAAIAANAAKRYIDPKSRLFPGHSSELKL
jgi:thioredoxin reductase (NADPH)